MTWFHRRPLLASSIAGVAVGVVVATTWSLLRPGSPDAGSVVAGPSTTSTTGARPGATGRVQGPPPTEAELNELVDELLRFVAQNRGLEADEPVEVELQGDDEFVAGLLDDLDAGEDLEGVSATLEALKLVPGDFDLEAELRDAVVAGVVGYYDPDVDVLYVRGTSLSPFVEVTLVHELVHALQDEHFGIERLLATGDDEAFAGAQALLEGDAELVADDYLLTLSSSEQADLMAEAGSFLDPVGDADAGVDVLEAVLGFPYLQGPEFVAALVARRGYDGVDAAFDDPPRSTEQIIHPERYLAGEEPIAVEPPEAEGEILDEGTLGEFLLGYLLDPERGDGTALDAAEGWGGDAYVTWQEDGRIVTAVRFVMDDSSDRDELVDALRVWARRHGDARVGESGRDVLLEASVAVSGVRGAAERRAPRGA